MGNVTTGRPRVSGAVYVAYANGTTPVTLPTDASTALTSTFKSLGYVSEDGVTNDNSPEVTPIKAWGGETVLNVQNDRPDSFKLKLIDVLSDDVMKVVYGSANVTTATSKTKVTATTEELGTATYVIDMALANGKVKRIVIPSGTISAIGTISYKDTEAVGYEITISCNSTLTGGKSVTHYEYID